LNYKFMVAEWLWIMAGSDNLGAIAQYNSRLAQFSDDGVVLAGAYGPRIEHQRRWVLNKLTETDTRQAVISIWTPAPPASKDIPCTLTLQFLRRGNVISLIVGMRSSDIWLGLPYDFFVFSQLLNCICGELRCDPGFVQFNLGSSHLYSRDLEGAMGLLDDISSGYSLSSLGTPGMPPRWLLGVLWHPHSGVIDATDDPRWWRYAQILKAPRTEALDILGRQSCEST